MPDPPTPDARRPQRGIIDTSVIVDLEHLEAGQLPLEIAVSAITLAEPAAGPHATVDADEARRQDRLQRAEAAFDPLPFDGEAARAYGGSTLPRSRAGARRAGLGHWIS
ncbi:MAG: PIN domain-containing protein [Acidimicrobiales bacterium]